VRLLKQRREQRLANHRASAATALTAAEAPPPVIATDQAQVPLARRMAVACELERTRDPIGGPLTLTRRENQVRAGSRG